MSAIIQLVAPAELLFQPSDRKENATAKEKAKCVTPGSLCESEPNFWKLSSEAAAADKPAFIDTLVLALFLLMAIVSTASCFAELSHLMQSDAIARLAMHAIRGGW
jgi:hypothetical protein